MTRDDIIRMAREASSEHDYDFPNISALERFAVLVAAAEREACAKACDDIRYNGYCPPEDGAAPGYYNDAAKECADAIRARGQ